MKNLNLRHFYFQLLTRIGLERREIAVLCSFESEASFFRRGSRLFITSVKFRGRRRAGPELVLQPRRTGNDRRDQIDTHDSVAESVRQGLTDRVKGFSNVLGFRR